jgi:molybdate transport system substrate-binding protein
MRFRSGYCVTRRLIGGVGVLTIAWVVSASIEVKAEEILVAVAANFTEPAKEIAQAFEKNSGHKLILSFGSTGQFYSQITQGAPFQVFLSADQATPKKAVEDGFAVGDTVFTYATGKIVLYSEQPDLVRGESTLHEANFQKIAIANPTTAPYGAAAVQAMKALGVYDGLKGKIVQGNNIAQTFQFVPTGSAELGFVALSQVTKRNEGSHWVVPHSLYSPIRQDAALLSKGTGAARAFLAFLKKPEAAAIIEKYGYGID